MKNILGVIGYIFIKIAVSFYSVFDGIIHIKDNLTARLVQIFSNLTTCVFTIISIVILVMFYIKNGISTQFNMSMNEYYYNNIFTIIFFITVILSAIFIFIKHFTESDIKVIILSIICLIIFAVPTIFATYMILVQEGIIPVNEAFANFITFNDHENGIKYFCIYSAISVVTLLISLAITRQWEGIANIIFGCAMVIIILPIFLIIASNIIAIIITVIAGLFIALMCGISISEGFEALGKQMEEDERERKKEKTIKKFIGDKGRYY